MTGLAKRRHTPDLTANELPIPLPTLIHDVPGLLNAALNIFAADEQTLNYPEDLTDETTAQIGLYPHRCQDGRTFSNRPGA